MIPKQQSVPLLVIKSPSRTKPLNLCAKEPTYILVRVIIALISETTKNFDGIVLQLEKSRIK